jgi:hypothetical protein
MNTWIERLEEYPGYRTKGEMIIELKDNLKKIYEELTSGQILAVRRVGVFSTEVELLRRNYSFPALLYSLKQDE